MRIPPLFEVLFHFYLKVSVRAFCKFLCSLFIRVILINLYSFIYSYITLDYETFVRAEYLNFETFVLSIWARLFHLAHKFKFLNTCLVHIHIFLLLLRY